MRKKVFLSLLCGAILVSSVPTNSGWISRSWRRMSTSDKFMTGILSAACLVGVGLMAYDKMNTNARYDKLDGLPKRPSRRNSVIELSDSEESPSVELENAGVEDLNESHASSSSAKPAIKIARTPLITALMNCQAKQVKKLMSQKVDINEPDSNGKTPFMHALANYDRKTFGYIWNKQPDLTAQDNRGWNWTMHAIANGLRIRQFTAILRSTKDVDNIDDNGITPVMYAAMDNNRSNYLSHLLGKNCALNAQDNDNKTALAHALETQSNRAIEELLEYDDIDPNLADNDLKTPLMKCIINGQYNYADDLLAFDGIVVQGADIHDNTALYYAIQMQRQVLVRAILQKYPAPAGINMNKEINLATELGGEIPGIFTNYRLGGGVFNHVSK